MGFKRYLPWYDAIYGSSGNWTDNNNHISKNCVVVTNSVVWTAVNNCLLSDK